MNTLKLRNHDIEINILNDITLKEFGHIYLFINKINGKRYIGQSIRVRDRISEHIQNVINKKNCVLYNAINRYGLENFEFSIIDSANNIIELNNKEIVYINLYKSNNRNFGYNIESGGKNSLASPETKKKLSDQRKGRKQNDGWVNKRNLKISKVVLKIDKEKNIILETYKSLADAGRTNSDGLSYQQLLRKCLGYSKNKDYSYWCYEDDFLSSNINKYKQINYKELTEFTEEELLNIYNEYLNNNVSIRSLSKKYFIYFSTLNKYIKQKEEPKTDDFNIKNFNFAVCKKTEKQFSDVINKSGALTTHIISTYPDFKIESKFKRKQIEMKTGMPWYYDFFIFK